MALSTYTWAFFLEPFSVGTVGRDVRRRFRGGTWRALPEAG